MPRRLVYSSPAFAPVTAGGVLLPCEEQGCSCQSSPSSVASASGAPPPFGAPVSLPRPAAQPDVPSSPHYWGCVLHHSMVGSSRRQFTSDCDCDVFSFPGTSAKPAFISLE